MTRMSRSPSPKSKKPSPSKPATSAKRRGRENSTTSSPAKKPRILGDGHLDSRTAAARKRLGVTEKMMEGVPDVTANIVRACGSVGVAIQALAQDDSEDARSFTDTYQKLSGSDRKRLRLEEIFTASGLSARRFVEVVTGALMQQCQDVTKMMVAVAQPKVIQATIKAATDQVPITAYDHEHECMKVVGYTNGDTKAMEIFHKATGFLPTPKGANTTINLNQLNQTANMGGDDEPDERDIELEDMNDYLMEIQGVVRPQLPASTSHANEIPTIVPEIEELEIEV